MSKQKLTKQELSKMPIEEIKRKIQNLRGLQWKMKQQREDPDWNKKERIRKRALYKIHKKNQVK